MYFSTKSYLKSTHNHTAKQARPDFENNVLNKTKILHADSYPETEEVGIGLYQR
jgi:hypothetical protein